MIISEKDYLTHIGTPRHSGRYPWGSGDDDPPNPEDFQLPRNMHFNDHVNNLRKKGISDPDIAKGLGYESTTQLRAKMSIASAERTAANYAFAWREKQKGVAVSAIARDLGRNESYVRGLLANGEKHKQDVIQTTASTLKDAVAEKKYVDVGKGVEHQMGIARSRLDGGIAVLKEQGYVVHEVPIPQVTTEHNTKGKVLAAPGTTQREVFLNRHEIRQVAAYSEDGGESMLKVVPPVSVDSKRVAVKWGPEGGAAADGVIYLRPGVEDLSLGGKNYAQVRVKVGESHYLKGMAMYKDDLPPGIDIQFNTNKKDTGNKLDAMKPIAEDTANSINPFGAIIRQHPLRDKDGKQTGISAMNIVNEEGDWEKWSNTLSSQMLSKQNPQLIKSQLDMTYEERVNNLKEISLLTNPTVKRDLLMKFAGATDSASVQLKGASLPRQSTSIILPINSLPPTHVYAPNYPDGTRVVLVRHPHSGPFEIPELVVDNSNREAKRALGDSPVDAIGIHHSVAEKLSGADFDGDHVLVIPNDAGKVKTARSLDGLKNFNPKESYPEFPGMVPMSKIQTQTEMGKIANLITDMTILGAPSEHLAAAVRHSMVVIDAEKHKLNYKQSYIDNGISNLKKRYQGSATTGAVTLISRAKAKKTIPQREPRHRREGGPIDPATGKRVFVDTGRMKGGVLRTMKVKKLDLAEDAHTLSSGTRVETIYANHSNRLKELANQARKEALQTPKSKYDASAAKAYAKEVKSLSYSLKVAERNAPLERQAQVFATTQIKAKRDADPNMDEATLKKVKNIALAEARNRTGASKKRIKISQEEWNAIQAGAISPSRLEKILLHADPKSVRELATPTSSKKLSTSKLNRAKAMLASGYTRKQVADYFGVSMTTLDTNVKE